MMPLALLLGLTLGTGLVLAFAAMLPAAPLRLDAALDQITTRTDETSDPRLLTARLARRAANARHPWLGLPTADLDLLERTPQQYLAQRVRGAALGTAIGTGIGLLASITGVPPTPAVILGVVGGAGLGGMLPYFQLRDAAARRREDYRRVLAVYPDLVAQERNAGRAATPALREAAELTEHPLFLRIRATVAQAHRLGHTPWDALRNLGDRLRLSELAEVADLADTAADGAAIATSLHTKAASLRHAALATDTADAHSRSERLTLPTSLLMLAILGLVLYPTLAQLLTT
ncbi:pilus assembly protein TadB [Saccharopolyspora sp. 6M]|uniref:pilus assembly protein TadB n=1 Tax=Saccharopolyspora sp. 6M TaxID=2877237 RepID=UPI001CD4654A|nr:pilus assembly protein TadB [Saccharopolyspora sp. 6M]MCA1229547.1 pilus assembly protein TadB [Saccharopolyspora sp. 6M]